MEPLDENKKYESKWSGELKADFARDISQGVKNIKTAAFFFKISSISRKVFWILAVLAVMGLAISGFYIYNYFSAAREISLNLSAPRNVFAGVPFELTVNFDNGSKKTLQNAELSIFLPENAVVLGENKDKRVFVKEIGDVEAGAVLTKKIPLLIFGGVEGAGDVKDLNVSVSYVSVLGTRFEKKQDIKIFGLEPAIKLDIDASEKVLNNEDFEIIVKYANASEYDFPDIKLNLELPSNFVFTNSVPEISGNVLNIGKLARNEKGELLVVGKFINASKSFYEINADIDSVYSGQIFKINEKSAKINIAPSPLFLKIELDNFSGFFLPGDTVRFRLVYLNNSDVGLSDAVIKAKLNGEMFDFSKLRTNGSFDSLTNILTWNAASNSGLRLIEPGGSGEIKFEIMIKSSYPIKRLSDKNFTLKAAAEISSPTVPYYVTADKTIGLANWEAKIAGKTIIEQKVYFRDTSSLASGFTNRGSLPPKVNQPVNFTIHWLIRNYATDIKDVNVSAYLGPGVIFVGEAKSNVATLPIYNERTQAITWQIDKIAATKGVISKPVEAVFQIELLPNITQAGSWPILVKNVLLNAVDEFVNVNISDGDKDLTTQDLSDSGFDARSRGEVAQ